MGQIRTGSSLLPRTISRHPTGEDSSDKDEDEVFVYQDQNFLLQDKVYGIDYETCYTMVEEDVSDPDAGPSPYSYYLLTACMQGCGSLGGCIVTRNGDSSTLHSIDRSNTPVEGWRDFTEFLYKCADEIYPYLALGYTRLYGYSSSSQGTASAKPTNSTFGVR